jgi:hypothetical protein
VAQQFLSNSATGATIRNGHSTNSTANLGVIFVNVGFAVL